jgi:lipopolysaccharide heptosyltransferase II
MKILLVRLREIGDVVFTTPAVRALRETFPEAHIAYLVEPAAADVVSANAHVDELIVAARRHLLSDIALGRRLRRSRYDLVIDFHGGPRASLLTWLSGAPARVGYDIAGRAWMYTTRVRRPRELRSRHAVENQWDLLAALGIPLPTPQAYPVEMTTDPLAAERLATRLAKAGVAPSDRLIVMHVGAGSRFRRWPRSAFVTLAAAIAERIRVSQVLVISGPSEPDAAEPIVADARARVPPAARDRIRAMGDLSLAELRALVDRAALFIGGDSGPLHIAATSTVPIVGVYGPTLPARSAPWRDRRYVTGSVEVTGLACRPCDQRVCAPGDFRCLAWISPEAVFEAAERVLDHAQCPVPQSR